MSRPRSRASPPMRAEEVPAPGGRLDAVLVKVGLARSRSQAAELIHSGKVSLDGRVVNRGSYRCRPGAVMEVETDPWVSRAAHKLIGALDQSGIKVGSRALDAGASTGGFTQVLLSRGADRVYAVDVGHAQLAQAVREDPRVVVRERLNLRDLTLEMLEGEAVDMVVADVSFISLRILLAPMLAVLAAEGVALLMVKPQFEVGRQRLDAQGVVRDPADRADAVVGVLTEARRLGWEPFWQADSTLPGPSGNVEHFVGLRRDQMWAPGTNK